MNFHTLDIEKTIETLDSSLIGLNSSEAERRLQEHGKNEITEQKKKPVWKMFLQQFADFMIVVLMIAAVLAGVIGDITDSYVILLIVILNAVIGFVQEYRAEKAMEALKKMAASNALVIRGRQTLSIPALNLVTGDVVILEAGNIIPADLRIIESAQLKVEEASLTGESHAVEKSTQPLYVENLPLGDRNNMAYKSTFVTYGRGKGIVVATGMKTELGKIAQMLSGDEVKTPLQKRLATFGKKLSYIILLICAVFLLIGILRGDDPLTMLLTAISLAVAAIPEALPALIVITLALGAKRLVKQNALIRKLPAVETLGSVTYICSDKTGTLTLNKMTVEEVFVGDEIILKNYIKDFKNDERLEWLLSAMALNNDVSIGENGISIGDPTEVAPYELAKNNSFIRNELETKFPRVAEIPFDSERKCMTTIHKWGNEYIAFTKGAVEVLISKDNSSTSEQKAKIISCSEKMAADGLRILGYTMRKLTALPPLISSETIETNLNVIGICGMMDPPREEVKEAVRICKTAGIKSVMITGDHPITAKTIAKRLGIIESENDLAITGTELGSMSEQEFKDKVEHIRVYARVSPEQKLNIVKALQEKGQFVAMTGDGVNDAPSLKRADIGIAMGITGTDVSKEAAHMILLDDNFTTIVSAVKQGRRIFDNIRKFIKYILTGNSAEIWAIFLAPFFGLPIPLLPIHILWINLITDGLPGLALAAEPAEKGVMNRPPRNPKENIFSGGLGVHILWVGLLMGIVSIGMQAYAISTNNSHWQTMVFTVLCFSQMGHVFAIRSDSQSLFALGIFSNKPLIGVITLTFILQFATIYVPFLNPIFKTEPLSLNEILMTLGVSSIVFFAVEIEKVIKRK